MPKPKTREKISTEELGRRQFCNSHDLPELVSDEGRRKRWVGIGWVDEGPEQGDEVLVVHN